MNIVKILIINGTARSGKDTFIGFLKTYYPKTFVHSTVSTVKKAAYIFGYTGHKTAKERKLLSNLKLAWSQFNDGPFNEIVAGIGIIRNWIGTPFIFSICVREPDEIQKIKNRYPDARTILIRRPGLELFDNMADQNVENFNYDFVINNDSTIEDFKKATIDFFNSNLKEELNA